MPAPSDSLRVGCVKYLNARPLIHGWLEKVIYDHPSALCRQLARGRLDIALVSSFEFLRNPIYQIVDAISISSDGPVYSVIVAHRKELSAIDEIRLDPAAETSVNLLRCLLSEKKLHPRFVSGSPSSPKQESGQLLIGDQAIRFRRDHGDDVAIWDLGQQWKKLTDLPFVYALWLVRPEVTNPQALAIADRLRALRDSNIRNLDKVVAQQKEIDAAFCKRYYREHLRFNFGDEEKKGLRTFQKLCEKHGLLPRREIVLRTV